MNEWEARYEALLAGISNQEYIKNAEILVSKAADMANSTPLTFEQAFQAMLQAVGLLKPVPQKPDIDWSKSDMAIWKRYHER